MIEYGIRFRDIRTVEKVFVVCCILHNMMLSEMETQSHDSTARVGRGAPLGMDSIWLQGNVPTPAASEGSPALRKANKLAKAWAKRKRELAEHLEYSKRSEKRSRIV